MKVAITGEDDDFVPIDAECRFFDALAEEVDPERFAGEGVEAEKSGVFPEPMLTRPVAMAEVERSPPTRAVW